MTEHERVQQALAQLPRPASPPRLHRRIMAQVTAEARLEAAAPQTQVWQQRQTPGTTVEWRQGGTAPAVTSLASPVRSSSVVYYRRRHNETETTIYHCIQTQ